MHLLGKDRAMPTYYVYIDGAFFAPVDSVQAVETIRNYWASAGSIVHAVRVS